MPLRPCHPELKVPVTRQTPSQGGFSLIRDVRGLLGNRLRLEIDRGLQQMVVRGVTRPPFSHDWLFEELRYAGKSGNCYEPL
jgi:hypothetical protein